MKSPKPKRYHLSVPIVDVSLMGNQMSLEQFFDGLVCPHIIVTRKHSFLITNIPTDNLSHKHLNEDQSQVHFLHKPAYGELSKALEHFTLRDGEKFNSKTVSRVTSELRKQGLDVNRETVRKKFYQMGFYTEKSRNVPEHSSEACAVSLRVQKKQTAF